MPLPRAAEGPDRANSDSAKPVDDAGIAPSGVIASIGAQFVGALSAVLLASGLLADRSKACRGAQ
jgi:hypothetical protein